MFRNLMAIDTEEMIRAQPMDAVVLVGGCDKTVPAQLMGALSAGRPAIGLVAGPMMTSRWQGERLGACTDCRRFWAKFRAGEVNSAEIDEIDSQAAAPLLADGPVFLDVRERDEWDEGHIPGAIHIGRGILERDVEEILIDGARTLVVQFGVGGGYAVQLGLKHGPLHVSLLFTARRQRVRQLVSASFAAGAPQA